MFLYVKTTADKYELPVAVADSPKELAQMLGIKKKTAENKFYRSSVVPHWYKVEVEDEDEVQSACGAGSEE